MVIHIVALAILAHARYLPPNCVIIYDFLTRHSVLLIDSFHSRRDSAFCESSIDIQIVRLQIPTDDEIPFQEKDLFNLFVGYGFAQQSGKIVGCNSQKLMDPTLGRGRMLSISRILHPQRRSRKISLCFIIWHTPNFCQMVVCRDSIPEIYADSMKRLPLRRGENETPYRWYVEAFLHLGMRAL